MYTGGTGTIYTTNGGITAGGANGNITATNTLSFGGVTFTGATVGGTHNTLFAYLPITVSGVTYYIPLYS
jgi:hypothetical protein